MCIPNARTLCYETFVDNLKKMRLMAKKFVFISLPYPCFGFQFTFKLMLGQSFVFKRRLALYLPLFQKNRRYREEYMREFPWAVHFWEIGRIGFPLKRIMEDVESAGLKITKTFRSGNAYHYFILAEKI